MRYNNFYPNFRIIVLSIFLLFAVFPISLFAQTKSEKSAAYDQASYNTSSAGKFMRTWRLAGPFPVDESLSEPDETLQRKIFKEDPVAMGNIAATSSVRIKDKNITWQQFSSPADVVNLDLFYKGKDFVYAYALSEIKSPSAADVILGLGSDDGVKVWLNGKLIHDNWVPRGIKKDEDLVPLKLAKGSNQLLIKVQDIQGGWGFIARLLDKAALTELLINAAAGGSLDKIKLLTDGGADINSVNKNGIAPITVAKISGRDEVIQLLLEKGAKDVTIPSSEIVADNFYSSLKEKEAPGIAVLVAKEGKIIYRKGFGYADIKNKLLVNPDTKFRIGSVTKQFTAAAILKLQENNLLSVDDKLSKFIPDFPRGDEVTIHHLLTHTSGINSYTGSDYFLERVTKTISPDSLINLIKRKPYDFNPGERFLYNNSGYFLLGYIIGKVSGKPYADYLKETFFDPLGMKNTGAHYAGIKLEQEAKGYGGISSKYEEALNWDMSWAGAAGNLYSTVDDLLKWNEALHSGKILNEKSLKAAITPVTLNNGEKQQYGYGLGLNKYRGMDIIGHSGGLHGFITHLSYYPKEKITVVMFSNTAEPEVNFDPNKIAEAFLWNKMEKQKTYVESKVKPKNLQLYAGRYDLSEVGVMMITTEGDRIFSQLGGQPKFEIFHMADDEFFWKVVEAKVKFVRDDKGEITHSIIFQNGMEFKGKKLKEETIIKINPAILDTYTGKYKFRENIDVIVSKENDKLFAQATGQPKLEMQPVSETDFVINEINAKISFVKEANGKANKFKLNMNGTELELPRIE